MSRYFSTVDEETRREEELRHAWKAVAAAMGFAEPLTPLQKAIVDALLKLGGVYIAAAAEPPSHSAASGGEQPVSSQDDHERVARAVVEHNPDLVRKAQETGNYIPLIRIAINAEPGLSKFWIAQRIGQLVREDQS